MPYRRLPNTDSARLRALNAIVSNSKDSFEKEMPLDSETLYKIDNLAPYFETIILNSKSNQANHLIKNKAYPHLLKKARLYVSHFIQVLNMAIARGEMKASIREYYGLTGFESKIPELNTEAEILEWGQAIIKGETDRTRQGGTPMTNPNIALLKVWHEKFSEAAYYKNTYQKSANRIQKEIVKLRANADEVILKAWNEIEAYFSRLPEHKMREHAAHWGVVYVLRPYERERIEAKKLQKELF